MPRNARSRLPDQVVQFLEAFATHGDGKTAAIDVGVHPRLAERFVRETMDHPDAVEAFHQIMRTRFSQAGPIAMNVLLEVAKDPTKPPGVRVEAANSILNRSGFNARAIAQGAAQKDMQELSREDLLRIVNQGEAELASRAKMVDHRPIDSALATQVIDIEG